MMKQNIIVISLSCFSLGGIVSSCSTPAEKVENAKEDVVGAKQELQTSKAAYEEDMVTFRELSDKKIICFKSIGSSFLAISHLVLETGKLTDLLKWHGSNRNHWHG